MKLDAVPELESEIPLSPAAIEALRRWQARPGEVVTLRDPEQTFYRARLTSLKDSAGGAIAFERFRRPVESSLVIEVFQALPQRERFELILQKLTELGVARIVPYQSQKSISLEERDRRQKKSHRWGDVVLRAAKQCRRGMLPELFPVLSWDSATYLAQHADLKLMLFEGDAPWSLREVLEGENPSRIALLVGPEGGFSRDELEEARQLGFLPVSVGPRILRTETAAIAGAAVVQYALGDLG